MEVAREWGIGEQRRVNRPKTGGPGLMGGEESVWLGQVGGS